MAAGRSSFGDRFLSRTESEIWDAGFGRDVDEKSREVHFKLLFRVAKASYNHQQSVFITPVISKTFFSKSEDLFQLFSCLCLCDFHPLFLVKQAQVVTFVLHTHTRSVSRTCPASCYKTGFLGCLSGYTWLPSVSSPNIILINASLP